MHLIDQYLWELIGEEEMIKTGQVIIHNLAERYSVDHPVIDKSSLDGMLQAWKELFNNVVISRIK